MRATAIVRFLIGGFLIVASSVAAVSAEPGWTPRVLKVGEREQTNAIDITQRPYRPFHFYGNSVRRWHYRGNPLPLPRDLANTVVYALRRSDEGRP